MTRALPAPGDTPRRALPVPGGPVCLDVPGRALLLVAGVPGAGKSTLLRRLPPGDGVRVLDSEVQRAVLGRVFPGMPYPRLRPWVHLLHRLAVVAAACGAAPTVVVHLPATGRGLRSAVVVLARLTGRTPHLLWIEAPAGEALRGQAERGRVVERGSFARHVARAEGVASRIRGDGLGEGWVGETALERREAAAGLALARSAASADPRR
ncbi:AAA family ATPase [Pseudonocardia xishanensis]|uniref:AAA domain-containing protein n=1 Tax=Pseudonocardia xishanensis TaxID=630995 RepID=A0ABP8RW66_9PSEU